MGFKYQFIENERDDAIVKLQGFNNHGRLNGTINITKLFDILKEYDKDPDDYDPEDILDEIISEIIDFGEDEDTR